MRWRPAALTRGNIAVITIFLAFVAINRGWDYLTPPETERAAVQLQVIEMMVPITVWGAAFIVAGVILLVGAIWKIHGAVWLGHSLCWMLYTVLAVGLYLPLIVYRDGVRSIGPLAFLALAHGLLMLRTGRRPLPEDEAPVVEQLQGGGA